jgi:PAS domain S-box-containing protein
MGKKGSDRGQSPAAGGGLEPAAPAAVEVLDNSPTATIVVDGNAGIIYANPSAEEILGVSRSVLVSGDQVLLWNRIPLTEREFLTASIAKGDTVRDHRVWIKGRGGRPVLLALSASPLRGSSSAYQRAVVTFTEITEQAWVEDALQLYMERLAILRAIDRAILTVRPPEEIARIVLKDARSLVPYDSAILYRIEDGSDRFMPLVQDPADEPPETLELCSRAEFLETAGTGDAILIPNIGDASDARKRLVPRLRGRYGSVIVVPLVADGSLTGCLLLAARKGNALTEEHAVIATEAGTGIGLSLQNASLISGLERKRGELAALARRVEQVQEEERRRFSRELHDSVGQNLAAIGIRLNLLHGQLDPGSKNAELGEGFADVQRHLGFVADRIREVICGLRPPVLDDYGLFAALSWLCRKTAERFSALIEIRGAESSPRLPQDTELTLFRIAQEALTNCVTHAEARVIQVELSRAGDETVLSIQDDGKGFDQSASASAGSGEHWGLVIMRERALSVGGNLIVESSPRAGTRVTVRIGGVRQ